MSTLVPLLIFPGIVAAFLAVWCFIVTAESKWKRVHAFIAKIFDLFGRKTLRNSSFERPLHGEDEQGTAARQPPPVGANPQRKAITEESYGTCTSCQANPNCPAQSIRLLQRITQIFVWTFVGPVTIVAFASALFALGMHSLHCVGDKDPTLLALRNAAPPPVLLSYLAANCCSGLCSVQLLSMRQVKRSKDLITNKEVRRFAHLLLIMHAAFAVAASPLCLSLLSLPNVWPVAVALAWLLQVTAIASSGAVAAFHGTTIYPNSECTECGCVCCSPNHRFQAPKWQCEERASLWKRLTFQWVTPLVQLGVERPLVLTDLFEGSETCDVNKWAEQYERVWGQNRPSLWILGFQIFWRRVLLASLYRVAADVCHFAGPLVIWRMTDLLKQAASQEEQRPIGEFFVEGCTTVALLTAACVATCLLQNAHWFEQTKQAISMRAGLQALLFDKALRVNLLALSENNVSDDANAPTHGKLLNLISVDCDRVFELWNDVPNLWCSVLTAILCIIFLWLRLGIAMLPGVGIMFCMIPVTSLLVRQLKEVQAIVMERRDRRVRATSEVFGGIRVIKQYAWELPFQNNLLQLRAEEIEGLRKWQLLVVVQWLVWSLVPLVVTTVSFGMYIALGNELTASKAFTSLTLFSMLRWPLSLYPRLLALLADALVSLKRLQEFFRLTEIRTVRDSPVICKDVHSVVLNDATVHWPNGSPIIKDATFACYPGTITAIVGRTGVGKSGLLQALLGDLPPVVPGSVQVHGRLAYVQQNAWLQNGSIRDNILFGRPFQLQWYARVLQACALCADIEIFPAKDMTQVGEKGVILSGGQKQRIAVARAVYRCSSGADVFLLDDCFSAVDNHVARHIFKHAILRLLKRKNKTVVLVTHRIELLRHADQVVFLERQANAPSFVAAVGEYTFVQRLPSFERFAGQCDTQHELVNDDDTVSASLEGPTVFSVPATPRLRFSVEDSSSCTVPRSLMDLPCGPDEIVTRQLQEMASLERERQHIRISYTRQHSCYDADDGSSLHPSSCPSMDGESSSFETLRSTGTKFTQCVVTNGEPNVEVVENGRVAIRVFKVYVKSLGVMLLCAVLLSLLLSTVAQVGGTAWVAFWVDHPDEVPSKVVGLGTYGALGLTQIALLSASIWLAATASLRASKKFHSDMLQRLAQAPVSWFAHTPLGQILNRFSRDLFSIDQVLPVTWRLYLMNVFSAASIFLVIAVATPAMIFILLPIASLYWTIQRYYIPGATQLRRIELVTRSPGLALFSEVLEGAATIRAYDEVARFARQHRIYVQDQARSVYPNTAFHRWLSVRVDTIGALVIGTTASLVVLNGLAGRLAPGTGALVISYALSVTFTLTFMVRTTSDLQTDLVAVERAHQYIELPEQERQQGEIPPDNWPSRGEITLEQLCLRYKEHLPLVLKNVSLQIQPGEKVGIVGRTGAGKSSLFVTLLRLVEPSGGRVIIDGYDTRRVALRVLRSRFSIIPQDPVLFAGTLRTNLDPLQLHTDQEVWDAAKQANLQGVGSKGLSTAIEEGGRNLSMGEKQLVCLARALLRRSKILLLDEATSAIDPWTDRLIHETIRTEFAHCTVLTIAHRIPTVMKCDRLLVLDGGKVAAFDSPAVLRQQSGGIFQRLCNDGT